MTEKQEIIAAIEDERELNNRPLRFQVEQTIESGDVFKVIVEPVDDKSLLDESLEGLTIKWTTPQPAHANILSVVPEDNLFNLRFKTGEFPPVGELIWVQIPDYLGDLHSLWQNDRLVDECFRWLHHPHFGDAPCQNKCPRHDDFAWLRPRQREAFRLFGYQRGFLWGPPGTGKTTTLGCMVAEYLVEFPYDHILLLSTSNTAVDQALIAVDKALGHLGDRGVEVRNECKRIGLNFIASHYDGRKHLLPRVIDPEDLYRRLAKLEAERPDPRNDCAFAAWRDAMDSIREEIRAFAREGLINARLAAMTTTRATFDFEELSDLGYDVVVFDEASQVGLAHALMLSRLGSRVVFAGDPKQLGPIVQSELDVAKCWLGRSMFEYMDKNHPSTCVLDEQNWMAEPICRVVSRVFYDNQLKVANDALADPDWHNERKPTYIPRIGDQHIYIHEIRQEGTPANPGYYRLNSRNFICQTVLNLVRAQPPVLPKDILVVTPFRAQRHKIRERLRELGLGSVAVTTVHRAQGGERHTILFDPVRGSSQFLISDEGRRIINVAISRAKARLVITLSRGDRQNPELDLIQWVYDNALTI